MSKTVVVIIIAAQTAKAPGSDRVPSITHKSSATAETEISIMAAVLKAESLKIFLLKLSLNILYFSFHE